MTESSEFHHILSPKPSILTESQIQELIVNFKLSNVYNLPKVNSKDKSLDGLSVKPGEVIKYSRSTGDYFRVIVD